MANILIVDDEPMVRQALVEMLEFSGHTVANAENGKEAAKKLQNATFDLLITDILMPERDGLETIMALKAERKSLPVIAVSGLNADSSLYLHMAKKLGARRTLPKPFTLEQLTSLVNEVLAEAKAS